MGGRPGPETGGGLAPRPVASFVAVVPYRPSARGVPPMSEDSELNRRRFLGAGAATVGAQLGTLGWAQPVGAEPAGVPPAKEGVRPYRIDIPEEQLADLRRRIRAT